MDTHYDTKAAVGGGVVLTKFGSEIGHYADSSEAAYMAVVDACLGYPKSQPDFLLDAAKDRGSELSLLHENDAFRHSVANDLEAAWTGDGFAPRC